MKSIYKKFIGTCLLIVLISACKDPKPSDTVNDTVSTEVTRQQSDTTDVTKMSLNDLIHNFNKEVSLRSAYKNEIYNRHEICHELFENYSRAFWKHDKTDTLYLDKDKIIENATDSQYVQFLFKKDKQVTDIHYDIVDKHAFNSYVSCFPVILIRDLINYGNFKKLSITKGYQYIPPTKPPGRHEGKYYITMLIFENDDKEKRYFDIVSDPTRMGAEPARVCPK